MIRMPDNAIASTLKNAQVFESTACHGDIGGIKLQGKRLETRQTLQFRICR
jgi:hypothetical protein